MEKYMVIEEISKTFNENNSKQKKTHFKMFETFKKEAADNTQISQVKDWAKDEGYLSRLDISDGSADKLLRSMLVEHNLPEELRNNPKIRDELKKAIIKRAGDGFPLPPDEAERAYELIKSGEIIRDVFYSLNLIFGLIIKPNRFSNLDDSFTDYLETLIGLPHSIISDLNPKTAFDRISTQLENVKGGNPINDPEILNNTLGTIYSAPEIGSLIEVINILFAPENETFRIALLVYARLNGINLEQKDIDEVRETILNKNDPKLGSLFSYLVKPENLTRLAGG